MDNLRLDSPRNNSIATKRRQKNPAGLQALQNQQASMDGHCPGAPMKGTLGCCPLAGTKDLSFVPFLGVFTIQCCICCEGEGELELFWRSSAASCSPSVGDKVQDWKGYLGRVKDLPSD